MADSGRSVSIPLSVLVGIVVVIVLGAGTVAALTVLGDDESATYEVDLAIAPPTGENRLLPDRVECPPDGRLADDEIDPLPAASFVPTNGTTQALVAPGQLVAFEFLVSASADAEAGGTLDLVVELPRATQRSMGFDPTTNVVCAFVDPTDPSTITRPDDTPTVARWQETPPDAETIRLLLAVQRLDPGERAVVELWMAAPRLIPETSPVLETRITAAEAPNGSSVRLERSSVSYDLDFFDPLEEPTMTLDVDDGPTDGVSRAERIDYQLSVTNSSADAISPVARLDGFLDSQLTLSDLSTEDTEGAPTTCEPTEDGFACDLGFMNPGEVVRITARAGVAANAERRFTTDEESCSGQNFDVCSTFALTWKRTEVDDAQVTVEEPTDVPGNQPLSILKLVPTAAYAYPGQTLDFTYQIANASDSGSFNQLRVSDSACGEAAFVEGDGNGNGRLDPGESWTYACTVEQITEEATTGESRVEAFTDDGRPVTASVTTSITLITPNLTVTVQPQVEDPAFRAISVTNGGDAELTQLALSHTGCVDAPENVAKGNDDDLVDPGETWTFTCRARSGQLVSVRAYATDPLENAVTASATDASS